MEILDKTECINIKDSILTIGNFDGVHKGHVEIIKFLKQLAHSKSSKSILVTFDPHPNKVLGNCQNHLITSLDKKKELLADLGIDFVYIVKFDQDFANIEADDFIKSFLHEQFKPLDIVVGYDHFFGKDRKGSFELLEKYKSEYLYGLHRVEKIDIEGVDVKSSTIRDYVKSGKVEKANLLLDRNFSFSGKIVKGTGRGSRILVPTANIELSDKAQMVPAKGVYHTNLFIKKDKKEYDSVCNIGVRPTFNDVEYARTIEVHVLNGFNSNIYDCEVELFFKSRIRDEIKFNDEKELINQINLDKEYCINN